MARRYKNLVQQLVFDAFNSVRNALLAAHDGNEVDEIIKAVLTTDERIKIGRRVQVAGMLEAGFSYDEIHSSLQIGKGTISRVEKVLEENKSGFELIFKREEKVEKEYKQKAYKRRVAPKIIPQLLEYTGFKKKDVAR